jgi:hypothetical protein
MDINDVVAVRRVWTVDEVKAQMARNDGMVGRALLLLLEKQTEDEQRSELTKYRNGQGFNAKDARFGSSLAKVVQSGKHLSPKQIESARKMLVKYSGQLTKIANEVK